MKAGGGKGRTKHEKPASEAGFFIAAERRLGEMLREQKAA